MACHQICMYLRRALALPLYAVTLAMAFLSYALGSLAAKTAGDEGHDERATGRTKPLCRADEAILKQPRAMEVPDKRMRQND
jgi:hypothetical protein